MQRRVLLLGAGGSAGANFVDALRLSADDYYIVGTALEPHYLELVKLDKAYWFDGLSSAEKLATVLDLIKKHDIKYVHAQPDPEVVLLQPFWSGQKLIFRPGQVPLELWLLYSY